METVADRQAYLTTFGETATWTKNDNTSTTVLVILHAVYADVGASVCDYLIQTSTEMMGLAKLREKVTIKWKIYTITDIRTDEQGWLEIQLER